MSDTADRMNALCRMTPEARHAEIIRNAFGGLFGQPVDLHAERVRRERADSEARYSARHQPTTPEAA